MYKNIFKEFEKNERPFYLNEYNRISDQQITSALQNPNPTIADFIALTSDKAIDHLEDIAHKSKRITEERFGKTIQLFSPLYFSSECSNKCTYCSFSMDNDIVRKTLTIPELMKEGQYLKNKGFSHVLLVAGEDNRVITTEYIVECIHSIKKIFPSVIIEIAPQNIEEYQIFAEAGCEGVTVYQETYDRDQYKLHHLGGKKRIFDYRIDTPDRACIAGMRNVAIGALFGLTHWQIDTLSIYHHLSYLQKKYWRTSFSIAFPRLRAHVGEYDPPPEYILNDTKLVQLICAFRICFPDTGIVLSTRESAVFRDQVFQLGITKMSAGSSTEVGGYTGDIPPNEPQFQLEDLRSAEEVAQSIKNLGYDPVWKDWEGTMHAIR
ncbi:MAG: 2-iminoacetate synthase ThiH [Planctomycetota bacterium]|nr:MAG: 2-iminoacetate synthase ThiH [Planctomycetota bacterium]